ncbi:hypothetical protein STEG23_021503 [Scotinomys teguina]
MSVRRSHSRQDLLGKAKVGKAKPKTGCSGPQTKEYEKPHATLGQSHPPSHTATLDNAAHPPAQLLWVNANNPSARPLWTNAAHPPAHLSSRKVVSPPCGHADPKRKQYDGLEENVIGVALLEEVYHCRMGFEVSFAQASLTVTASRLPVACKM